MLTHTQLLALRGRSRSQLSLLCVQVFGAVSPRQVDHESHFDKEHVYSWPQQREPTSKEAAALPIH